MLRRRRLSSGVRLGPPLPMRLLNKLGPLVRSLGIWPSVDVDRQMRATERKYKRNNWTPEFRRALPPRAEGFNSTDADLSLFGAFVIRGQFLKSMDNALALEDLIARYPQILDEQIRRPLFVLGLARTGTTLLQRLLSLHAGARYLPFWEGYTPYPRQVGNHQGGKDGRYREAKNRLRLLDWVGREFNKMHPIAIDDPEECYHLFRNHFLVPPGFDFANVPSYWRWWDERAHADAYRMHKRQLQALQWLQPQPALGAEVPQPPVGHEAPAGDLSRRAHRLHAARSAEDGAVAVQPDGRDVGHDLRHRRSATTSASSCSIWRITAPRRVARPCTSSHAIRSCTSSTTSSCAIRRRWRCRSMSGSATRPTPP